MLDVKFRLTDLTAEAPVRVTERRGAVTYDLHRGLYLPEAAAALNAATARLLAGGTWFQLWRGEVISIAPEKGAGDGRVHRGPLAYEETGPDHR